MWAACPSYPPLKHENFMLSLQMGESESGVRVKVVVMVRAGARAMVGAEAWARVGKGEGARLYGREHGEVFAAWC